MSKIVPPAILTMAAALVLGSASGAFAAPRGDHMRATSHTRVIERSAPVYNQYEGFAPYAGTPRDFYDHAKGDIAND